MQTSTDESDRTKCENDATISKQPQILLSPATLSATKDNRNDPATPGYSETTLTTSENESIKPTSPSCLRPYRKVEDVTTVKRQPKSGWLW